MTAQLLAQVKRADEDFEWYPTTNEILEAFAADWYDRHNLTHDLPSDYSENIRRNARSHRLFEFHDVSALDVGTGDGKVLRFLREKGIARECYVIEKSQTLLSTLSRDFTILGTDFHEQTLWDKSVDLTFCNPPYSNFSAWADKIIRETASADVYMVLPARWETDARIAEALKFRGRKARIVGEFSFKQSEDRKARARVHLVHVLFYQGADSRSAFDCFFDETFSPLVDGWERHADFEKEQKCEANQAVGALVDRGDFVSALVALYGKEMQQIREAYLHLCSVDIGLLKELEITIPGIRKTLAERFDNLKKHYWKLLFDNMDKLTSRLTTATREDMLRRLFAHNNVDFTLGNILTIVVWAIENANEYIDSQLIATYAEMVEGANVINYNSNQRTLKFDRWRYKQGESSASHFKLDYRLVLSGGWKGMCNSPYSFEQSEFNGLSKGAWTLLCDLLTIANNLGFPTSCHPRQYQWSAGKAEYFFFEAGLGKTEELMKVRCFKNGNMHLQLHPSFMLALNVEHGRLKGWVHSRKEAVAELDDMDARLYFDKNQKLSIESLGLALPDHNTQNQ
mgnify:CR=1 FL=1